MTNHANPETATLAMPSRGRALAPNRAQAVTRPASSSRAEQINEAYERADNIARAAVKEALICGQLILEQRASMFAGDDHDWNDPDKPNNRKFTKWLETNCPKVSISKAYRWMKISANVMASAYGDQLKAITNGALDSIPISEMLVAEPAELPAKVVEWRQTLFSFIEHKTMKECLAGVVVEGNEPHSITRAHNGRTQGGKGGNRKNFVGFTETKLKHLSTFFSHDLTDNEQAKIIAKFGAALQKWPRWLLGPLGEEIRSELKLSDEERAGR